MSKLARRLFCLPFEEGMFSGSWLWPPVSDLQFTVLDSWNQSELLSNFVHPQSDRGKSAFLSLPGEEEGRGCLRTKLTHAESKMTNRVDTWRRQPHNTYSTVTYCNAKRFENLNFFFLSGLGVKVSPTRSSFSNGFE
jgi:hypothetical protein